MIDKLEFWQGTSVTNTEQDKPMRVHTAGKGTSGGSVTGKGPYPLEWKSVSIPDPSMAGNNPHEHSVVPFSSHSSPVL